MEDASEVNELTAKQLGKLKLVYPLPLKLSSCCGPPTLGASRPLLHNLEFDSSCQPHPYGTFPLQLDDVIGTERWQYMSGQRRRATSTHSWAHKLRRCDTKWSCSCRDTKISTGCWVGMTTAMWVGWSSGGWGIGGLATRLHTLIGCGEYTQEWSFDGKCAVWAAPEKSGGVSIAVKMHTALTASCLSL